MKRVVSNATPLRYLAEIHALHLLPHLFERVVIPVAVEQELTHQHAPQSVRTIMLSPPEWLAIQTIHQVDATLSPLDPGEREAIILACELGINIILRNAIECLRRTTFRVHPELLQRVLKGLL